MARAKGVQIYIFKSKAREKGIIFKAFQKLCYEIPKYCNLFSKVFDLNGLRLNFDVYWL